MYMKLVVKNSQIVTISVIASYYFKYIVTCKMQVDANYHFTFDTIRYTHVYIFVYTYMYMYMYTCSPHITCTLVPFYIFSNVNFHKVLLSFFKPTVRTCTCIVEIDCMGVNKTFDRVLRAFA